MLKLLHIENIAVIESADIEFDNGFNVLTGETGAGKSIIIDSINELLGGRVSRELIRDGAQKAIVHGIFGDISDRAVKAAEKYGFEVDDDELMLSREIRADGKSVCRIGGMPATAAVLREIGSELVAVHGQHDTTGLLNQSTHTALLDSFAKDSELFARYREAFDLMNGARAELDAMCTDERELNIKRETLKFQIDEIERAGVSEQEERELCERRGILQSAEKVTDSLNCAYDIFYGAQEEIGVCQGLTQASRALGDISRISERFSDIAAKTNELRYAAEDILVDIRSMKEEMDFSPDELENIEQRLDVIYRIKRKYGCTDAAQLAKYYDKITAEYDKIENSGFMTEQLEKKYDQYREQAEQLALELSAARQQAAQIMGQRVNKELAELDMKNASFCCRVEREEADNGRLRLGSDGCDSIGFYISANAGESEKPLEKVASGGELSRIMLALKNILSEDGAADTMIFDEIDTGVSGRAAGRIGEKLYSVSLGRQVLCVTHLAQIAVFADRHMLIKKQESDGRTYTTVDRLDNDGRCVELARIISGRDITENARNAAEEMIELCGKDKLRIKSDKER